MKQLTQQEGLTAYLAPEGFTQELLTELTQLCEVQNVYDRLIVVSGRPDKVAWAQNMWLDPVLIKVDSISGGAKALMDLGKWWVPYSFQLHRRTALIQEKLPKFKTAPISFLGDLPMRPLSSWTLLDRETILASARCTSAFPNGEVRFLENKVIPPSRAYLKLWELFTVHGVRPQPGERVLDMGSSPGGWTWVLQQMGCDVVSVDRAPLEPAISSLPRVTFRQGNAFTLKPEEIGRVDWFFSDIISYPEQLLSLVEKWRASGLVRNFVCTIKFKGQTDHNLARRFSEIPGSRVFHQFHNKHELTWVSVAGSGSES